MQIRIIEIENEFVKIGWDFVEGASLYRVLWADTPSETVEYKILNCGGENEYELKKSTHVHHYIKVEALNNKEEVLESAKIVTPLKRKFNVQLEKLNRGLVAVKVNTGIFLSWRMYLNEVEGSNATGLTGADYAIYRNDEKIAVVTDSTNYIDINGTNTDKYSVAAIKDGKEDIPSEKIGVWENDYLDIPMQKPLGGVTPAGESFEYTANDMSVGDVDGDGELEFFVKWDPTNSHDVSIKGYTGKCYLDCYKLDGTLLFRIDMGVNIRAGAHYTQFMVYDFNGDGKAEIAVKTAPGTNVTIYNSDGNVRSQEYITLPEDDIKNGVTNQDNYVCSADDYRNHLIDLFLSWHEHSEVKAKHWPATLEECFGIEKKYEYPLKHDDAEALVDYFLDVYAPSRSNRNELRKFEGFIYDGPEYLTMFGGDGHELQTIPYRFPREDDGLMWGDYALKRIEPCNRVDRFNAVVAYLDGERPYMVFARGYYTRSTLVAYDFFENKFNEIFAIDSGYVPMKNPFNDDEVHENIGTDPVYGELAGQGNHSVSVADVDQDGYMEIIYGAATIDHDGTLLYSSKDTRPDGVYTKLGHGDAMHVAKIDPDRPGLQIFNVFEGGSAVPYGYALRDAEDGSVLFGEYATTDLGRCMIGKVTNDVRGLQVWVNDVYDCKGNKLDEAVLGTNMCIHWSGDLTTQITDSPKYIGTVQRGIINDNIHGVMLEPENTMTNNGTKGNPCLVADIFGDFREELLLRTEDSSAIRIYTNTDITKHKMMTLLHDAQYRCGVAWQNNCYNQPGYTSFYYSSDMDFETMLIQMGIK